MTVGKNFYNIISGNKHGNIFSAKPVFRKQAVEIGRMSVS